MKWLIYILLPLQLLSQETYDNCLDISPQTYEVSYDTDKEYYWWVSAGDILSTNNNTLIVQWPDSVGVYTVYVSTIKFGCLGDTSYHRVKIEDCDITQLFFPASFTPNGDGKNEVYNIRGKLADRIKYMCIYNRWGEQVFEADSNKPWNGDNCQTGVYTIRVFLNNHGFVQSITLVR